MVYLIMPAMGKEIQRQLTPDEIALREIQGYIDKVERQVETQQPQTSRPASTQDVSQPIPSQPVQDIASLAPPITKQKIVLPLDQRDVEGGLKKGVIEGVRWLAEWCVMMIKKYPGRVFYMPNNVNK